MSSNNYENQILEAIQMVVDNAVKKANYDKTIKGTISRCVDATIGKYIVKYQNSSFYAFTNSAEMQFSAGTNVYILVPGNDMSQQKTIIGAVDKLGTDYISIIEGEDGYSVVGQNVIGLKDMFGLCSYKESEVKILYSKEASLNLIGLDAVAAIRNITKSNAIVFGAKFKTNLPLEQQYQGDYGIGFELNFKDNGTGGTIQKNYLVSVDNMTGNPFTYKSTSRQTEVYQVDGANFIDVNKIYIFQKDFIQKDDTRENDIFISEVELSGCNRLNEEEISTQVLSLLTPKGGYFDDRDGADAQKIIQAQVRIKGKIIDNDSQQLRYYWFKENGNITPASLKYNKIGGTGWECLNNYNVLDETDDGRQIVEWVSGKSIFNIRKEDHLAKETIYKCVAVYANETTVANTISIENFDSQYEITIKSDQGQHFFYDLGNPSLNCQINTAGAGLSYIWNAIDNKGNITILDETTELNNSYSTLMQDYNELQRKLREEEVLIGGVTEDLNFLENQIAAYKKIMRVKDNNIYALKVSDITNFSTYRCSVYQNNNYLGSGSIIITNSLETTQEFTLNINNGNEVFKYNEFGVAPNSKSLDNPISILPLDFTLYNEVGQKIDLNALDLKKVSWVVPTKNTLISMTGIGNPTSEDLEAGTATYTEYAALPFNIGQRYDIRKNNNTIQLIIEYKNKIITAATQLIFTKEGEQGTNGTNYVCKIRPNNSEDDSNIIYPTVVYNTTSNTYKLNYVPVEANKWLKAELWEDGEKIFNGISTSGDFKVKWSILKNKYSYNIDDKSNLTIGENNGIIDISGTRLENPANIVKCTIEYKGNEYYACMPITIVRIANDKFSAELKQDSGFREVMYTADGANPSYDSVNPFEITMYEEINGIKEDVSLLTETYAVDYVWDVYGRAYFSNWQDITNLLIRNKLGETLLNNQKRYVPIDKDNAFCVTNGLRCNIKRGTTVIAEVIIPIHFYINRFGNATLNGWDGNSIAINEDEGFILSPQVGAGYKDDNNAFNGVFMGSVKEAGNTEIETGLFGYYAGQRTVSINSNDGSAAFGSAGQGQIIIDPSTGKAVLQSGNYDEDAGTGMQIDLTEPSIKFGSGNFSVDANGHMTAVGFATTEQLEDIENSIKYLNITFDNEFVLVPADNKNKPILNKTYTVNYEALFKGNPVNVTATFESPSIANIEETIVGKTIKFEVTNSKAIRDMVNPYTIRFAYSDKGKIYAIEKVVTLSLVSQGTTGQGVKDIIMEFYLSSSKTEQSDGEWLEQMPSWSPGSYLWTRNKITYENPTSIAYTSPQCDSSWEATNDILVGARNYIRGSKGFIEGTDSWSFETAISDWSKVEDSEGYTTIKASSLNPQYKAKSNLIPIAEFKDSFATLSLDMTIPFGTKDTWETLPLFSITYYREDGTDIQSVSPGIGYPGIKNTELQEQLESSEAAVWNTINYTWEIPNIAEASYFGLAILTQESAEAAYRKSKIERGTIATDWTPAPEDTSIDAVKSIESQYCVNKSSVTPPAEDAAGWTTGLVVATPDLGEYLWSRTVTTTEKGVITYSKYSCLVQSQKEIVLQESQYILSNQNQIIPNEGDAGWSTSKPTSNNPLLPYLWMRTHIVFNYIGATSEADFHEYYNYTLDTSWNSLFDITSVLTNEVSKILEDISGGYVKIEGGVIAIGDDADNPDNLIIINNKGIAFFDNASEDGWPSTDIMSNATSAWNIDGSLNMKDIAVSNLEATSIVNQNLVLGNDTINGASVTGDLDIYDKNGNIMFETIVDSTKTYIDGFKIHKYITQGDGVLTSNGFILFSRELGFGEYNSEGTKIFGKEDLRDAFFTQEINTEKQIIADTIEGSLVGMQIMPMKITNAEDNLLHQGIAFVKYENTSERR